MQRPEAWLNTITPGAAEPPEPLAPPGEVEPPVEVDEFVPVVDDVDAEWCVDEEEDELPLPVLPPSCEEDEDFDEESLVPPSAATAAAAAFFAPCEAGPPPVGAAEGEPDLWPVGSGIAPGTLPRDPPSSPGSNSEAAGSGAAVS
ncbi:hypothetical protein CF54_15995 [Streptomyces sp. Tu 6176]|nr:hypothetical protein CF54_15995 [Streptomyces sp. Tu 6176]